MYLQIDYPDIEYSKHRSRLTASSNHMTNIENYLGLETHDAKMVQGRYPDLHSESVSMVWQDQYFMSCQ